MHLPSNAMVVSPMRTELESLPELVIDVDTTDCMPPPKGEVATLPSPASVDLPPQLDHDSWYDLLASFRKLGVSERVQLLAFARQLAKGGDNIYTIGLGRALAEVDRVIAFNQDKHPSSKWKSYTATQHLGKMIKHAGNCLYGERRDPETERSHIAHSIARGLMALQCVLETENH